MAHICGTLLVVKNCRSRAFGEKQMDLRSPGSILLISCYELGHQPTGVAMPMAFLERAGFAPDALDIAAEQFDLDKVAKARFIGISVLNTCRRQLYRPAMQCPGAARPLYRSSSD